MIRDKDPIVITNCMCALNEILADEGGVVWKTSTFIFLYSMHDHTNVFLLLKKQCLFFFIYFSQGADSDY